MSKPGETAPLDGDSGAKLDPGAPNEWTWLVVETGGDLANLTARSSVSKADGDWTFIPIEGEWACADNVGENGPVDRRLPENEGPGNPGTEDVPEADVAEDVELAEDMDEDAVLPLAAVTPAPEPGPTAFTKVDGGGEKNLEVGGEETV